MTRYPSAAPRLRTLCCLGLILLWHGAGGADDLAYPLEGSWQADMQFQGQPGQLVVEFRAAEQTDHAEGALTAVISLPTIDAWEIAALPVSIEDGVISLGGLIALNPESGPLLRGVLPDGLVPVHSIPFDLKPVSSLQRPTPQASTAPAPQVAWEIELGSPVWAGLTVHQDRLLVATDDGVLHGLDTVSGQPIWTYRAPGPIRATSTAAHGLLYVYSDDGSLTALDSADGLPKWSVTLDEAPLQRIAPGEPGYRYHHYSAAPVIVDDLILAAHRNTLYARRLADGQAVWQFQADDPIGASPAVDQQRVIFGAFDGRIRALNLADGSLLWQLDTGAAVTSVPAVADGRVIVGSRSYDIHALDTVSGEPVWRHYLWYSWVESSAVVSGDRVYIGSSDAQRVSALALADGELHWQADVDGSAWSRPAIHGHQVYQGTVGVADYMVDHQAGLVALDKHSGRVQWHYRLPRPGQADKWGFAANPVVDEQRVFAATLTGRVLAFRHRTSDP